MVAGALVLAAMVAALLLHAVHSRDSVAIELSVDVDGYPHPLHVGPSETAEAAITAWWARVSPGASIAAIDFDQLVAAVAAERTRAEIDPTTPLPPSSDGGAPPSNASSMLVLSIDVDGKPFTVRFPPDVSPAAVSRKFLGDPTVNLSQHPQAAEFADAIERAVASRLGQRAVAPEHEGVALPRERGDSSNAPVVSPPSPETLSHGAGSSPSYHFGEASLLQFAPFDCTVPLLLEHTVFNVSFASEASLPWVAAQFCEAEWPAIERAAKGSGAAVTVTPADCEYVTHGLLDAWVRSLMPGVGRATAATDDFDAAAAAAAEAVL